MSARVFFLLSLVFFFGLVQCLCLDSRIQQNGLVICSTTTCRLKIVTLIKVFFTADVFAFFLPTFFALQMTIFSDSFEFKANLPRSFKMLCDFLFPTDFYWWHFYPIHIYLYRRDRTAKSQYFKIFSQREQKQKRATAKWFQ